VSLLVCSDSCTTTASRQDGVLALHWTIKVLFSVVYSCISVKGALADWREFQRRDTSLRVGEKYALKRRASRMAARIAGALNIQTAK